jgi:predicted secreted protein
MKSVWMLFFFLLSTLTYGQKLGTTISRYKVKLNDTIDLEFHSNPSAGFLWNVSRRDGACVDSLAFHYELFATGMPALGGIEKWKFKAVSVGTARYTFCCQRPWETNKPAIVKEIVIEVFP